MAAGPTRRAGPAAATRCTSGPREPLPRTPVPSTTCVNWKCRLTHLFSSGGSSVEKTAGESLPLLDLSPAPPSFLSAWRSAAIPLATADPAAPLDDLAPLRDLIGEARV